MSGALNDSATGGYLLPEGAPPLYDLDLDLVFQALVVGITGLPGHFVRPRVQPTTPKRPEVTENWCSTGVTTITPDNSSSGYYDQNEDGGLGAAMLTMHERLVALSSFYGPNGQAMAMQFHQGVRVEQNREALRLANIGYVRLGDVRLAPSIVNNQTQRKYDVELHLNRAVNRQYPVRYVLAAIGAIHGGGRVDATFDTNLARIKPRGN